MIQANLIRNLEFKIAFSETNLRYLAGEPESEKREKLIKFNSEEIDQARKEIEKLQKISLAIGKPL
jgi:hypothetical protein